MRGEDEGEEEAKEDEVKEGMCTKEVGICTIECEIAWFIVKKPLDIVLIQVLDLVRINHFVKIAIHAVKSLFERVYQP